MARAVVQTTDNGTKQKMLTGPYTRMEGKDGQARMHDSSDPSSPEAHNRNAAALSVLPQNRHQGRQGDVTPDKHSQNAPESHFSQTPALCLFACER